MTLNEADTRARLIDPRLDAVGWGHDQLSHEHYYRRDVQYTPGRIVLRGDHAMGKSTGCSIKQLKGYALIMGIPFCVYYQPA